VAQNNKLSSRRRLMLFILTRQQFPTDMHQLTNDISAVAILSGEDY
jgi:hypothetical protein